MFVQDWPCNVLALLLDVDYIVLNFRTIARVLTRIKFHTKYIPNILISIFIIYF